jgi:hypothetical protein
MERTGGGVRLKGKIKSKGANERAKATGTARATATTTVVVPMMRDAGRGWRMASGVAGEK